MPLRLRLLGPPRLEDPTLSDLPLDRPALLAYYLVGRRDWVRRSELAYLYNPEAEESAAFNNLRKLIFRLKQYGWAKGLESDAVRVRLNLPSDVQEFKAALEEQNWARALEVYGGTFLEGVAFPDLSGYEAWLELEREELKRGWRGAVLEHARALESASNLTEAETWLARLLRADSLDEDAMQAMMRVLHALGQRTRALEVYEQFRANLKREMQVEPLESTRALVESLRQSQPAPVEAPRPRHNLPTLTSRFVGRKRELGRLGRQLLDPECRLLTLVGLGGMGKTRLALELVSQHLQTFADGVWLVPLVGVASPDLLVSSIASALGLTFSGPSDPKAQLVNYLRGKQQLLLLDNFEHLIEGGLLLEELLTQAPGLKLLVTSRVALELSGEWLYDLEGLSYPPLNSEEDLDGFDAVRLFINRAERLSSTFIANVANLEAIAELARRVQGMPLALELAATWVRGLSVSELVVQLSQSFDLLRTTQQDVPERHRNLQAVLDYTWKFLSPSEQTVLAKLSVFRGGFTLDAAQAVAEAHLGLLLRFINQALVRRGEDGRYDMHELVRQYAAEKLVQRGEKEQAFENHLRYCQALAKEAEGHLNGEQQVQWKARLRADHGNFLSALEWGFEHRPDEAVVLVAYLGDYWHSGGLYDEGDKWFQRAIAQSAAAPVEIQIKVYLQRLRIVLIKGDFAAAQGLEPIVLALCQQAGDANLEAEFYSQIGWAATVQRQFDKASALLQKGLSLVEQVESSRAKNLLLLNLGQVLGLQQDAEKARGLLQDTLKMAYERKDIQLQMRTLTAMAWGHLIKEEYEQSIALSEEALVVAKLMDAKPSLAAIKGNIGFARWQLGEYREGERLYREHLILLYEQGSLINFYENAFELAQFWNHLGFTEDAVCLWGAAEHLRITNNYVVFNGYDQIKAKVLDAVPQDKREELLLAGKSKSPQELLQFLRAAARG